MDIETITDKELDKKVRKELNPLDKYNDPYLKEKTDLILQKLKLDDLLMDFQKELIAEVLDSIRHEMG